VIAYVDSSVLLRVILGQRNALPEWRRIAQGIVSALAAFALPGVGGLLIICAAGMRFGYRQAKAALEVRTTGISRFARQGPLGVVRSGSLVAVHPRHPRTLRVIRPERPRAAPLLEEAA